MKINNLLTKIKSYHKILYYFYKVYEAKSTKLNLQLKKRLRK